METYKNIIDIWRECSKNNIQLDFHFNTNNQVTITMNYRDIFCCSRSYKFDTLLHSSEDLSSMVRDDLIHRICGILDEIKTGIKLYNDAIDTILLKGKIKNE